MQLILNEIQPRDTNDYFNHTKILKECDSFDLEDLSTSVSNIDSSAEVKGKIHKTDSVISGVCVYVCVCMFVCMCVYVYVYVCVWCWGLVRHSM